MEICDASLERLHSVSGLGINCMMSPSDAFDLESPLKYTVTYTQSEQ